MSAQKILLALLAGSVFVGTVGAQDFQPPLGETIDVIVQADGLVSEPPAGSPINAAYPMESVQTVKLLDELPGRPLNDLEEGPRKFAWWKVPIYTVFGLPRDVVDAGFGFVGKIPVVNIPVTGLAYEVVPTQVFIRHHRDWHKWPGRRNKNKHGWIDSESWGWFPSLNQTKFRYVSEKKLEKLKAENVQIKADLAEKNIEIERRNEEITQRQRVARDAAVLAMDAGRHREAIERMLPYYEAYPRDETAFSLLIKALALYGDEGEPWVRGYLWQQMLSSSLRALVPIEGMLAGTLEKDPGNKTLNEALIVARVRLGDFYGAHGTAQRWAARSSDDAHRARVAFESAMDLGEADVADETWRRLVDLTPEAELARANVRYQILLGQSAQVLPGLIEASNENPDDAYLLYYRGVAQLEAISDSPKPEVAIQEALAQLESASLAATFPPLVERVGKTLSFTRALVQEENPEEEEEESGFFQMGF